MAARRGQGGGGMPSPKNLAQEPGLIQAYFIRLVGRLVTILMQNGVVNESAQALVRLLEELLGRQATTLTLDTAIAGAQTVFRNYGGQFGLSRTMAEGLVEIFDEVGDGLTEVREKRNGVVSIEEAEKIARDRLRVFSASLKELTFEEAWYRIPNDVRREIAQKEIVFTQQGEEAQELWEKAYQTHWHPSDLFLLAELPIERWGHQLEAYIKRRKSKEGGMMDKVAKIFALLKGKKVKEIRATMTEFTREAHNAERGTRIQQRQMEDMWHKHDSEFPWKGISYLLITGVLLCLVALFLKF